MAKKKKKQLDIAKEFENAVYVPLETRQQIEEERKKQREQQSRLFDGGSGSFKTKAKNTAADVTLQILNGGLGAFENTRDMVYKGAADVADFVGFDNWAKKQRDFANKDTTGEISNLFEHILAGDLAGKQKDEDIDVYEKIHEKSALTDRSRGIVQSAADSAARVAMLSASGVAGIPGAAGKVSSFILSGANVGTGIETRAIREGVDADVAKRYGFLGGLAEQSTESMFGGLGFAGNKIFGFGAGGLDDVFINNVTKYISSPTIRNLVSGGLRFSGEGTEEVAGDLLEPFVLRLSGMSDESISKLMSDQEFQNDFWNGFLSAAISSSGSLVNKTIQGTDYNNGTTKNEQKVIEDIIDQRTQGRELSNKERGDLRQQITQDLIDGKIAGSEIDRALQNTETTWNQNKDRYITRTVINENTKFTTTDDDLKIDKKQLNKNANLEDVQNKIKVLEQDFLNANNDVRNTTSSHELFDEMKRMIVATGEQQRLTSNKQMAEDGALKLLTNKKGEPIRNGRGELQYVKADTGQLVTINGYHTKDGMVLNSDSHQIFESTMGHELGESLKANTPEIYKQLRDLAVEVGKADGTLTKETFDAIKSTYGELGTNTDNYLDEYVNDKIGEMFKSDSAMFQEIGKKPNIARRLLDEIKYLIQKFTAGSPEQKRLLEAQHNLKKALQESVRDLNVNQETTQQETQQKTENIQQQTTEDIAPVMETKQQVKEKPKKLTEVTDEDLFNINMEEVENQFDKQEYKLNEDADDETPFGNYWDLDDYNFKLKDGNTLWIETPREYGKYKNGKTNYQQEIYNKIDFMIEDSNGEIIDEYSIENEKGEFTREDILNAIKHMTYDDSNKVADGQLDIFDNVHRNDGHRYSLSQDNQGRELSQQQQEYFKDSAIRVKPGKYGNHVISEDGQLFEVYHGTNNEFYVFDNNYRGSSSGDMGWYGPGYYFAFSEKEAKIYGSNVIKAYLNIKKPFFFQEEMQSYDNKTSGDVFFDFGSFMINMKNKFPDISSRETIKYHEYSDELGDWEIKDVSIKEVGQKIEDVYKSDNFKLVTINDNGVDKYQYVYQENIDNFNVPKDIKELIENNMIYNKSDAKFAVENSQYYRADVKDLEKLLDYFNENNFDFSAIHVGHPNGNKELMEGARLSEATWYVEDNVYHNLDQHMPEYYMQYLGNDIRQELEKNGYDGVAQSRAGDEIVAFYPEQIKNVDNTKPTSNPDRRYSLSVAEANTGKDNDGRTLSKGQQDYFKESKATDENGNLVTVYHTMTDWGKQFNEFNPVGSENYRYGNQIVNFYTDSQDMSGSYADQDYRKADTRKLNSLEEANKYLENSTLRIVDLENTNPAIKNHFKDTNERYLLVTSSLDVFGKYNTEDELLRNVIPESQYAMRNNGKYQYEGYLNMKNPYIIDAEGEMWNHILNKNALELKKQIKEKWDVPERQLDKLEGDTLKELNRDLTKLGWQLKKDKYGDLGLFSKNFELAIDMVNVNDVLQEIRDDLNNDLRAPFTTNDIVFQTLAENEFGANYDGVIIKNVVDNGGATLNYDKANTVYVTFEPNQFKSFDNQNPTKDPDIRYSLSESKQTTDSNGKELTTEQLDYFKDSKILDNEGRLLEVYHGTPSQDKFTIFDPNRAGENTLSGEYGLYFTDSKEFADDFSYERLESDSMFFDIKGEKGNVYTNYLNVTNPLDFAKLTKEDISNLYDYASYIGQLDGKERFVENMLNWQQIGNHQLMKGNLDLKAIADNSNYDGVIAKLNVQGNENEYIVFNSNQVKNVDNTNPTSNPDIRYSLSVSEANTGVDNHGNTVNPNMRNFMAESKATDENGNIVEVFHTMTDTGTQFNEFNPVGTEGYRFGDQVVNFYTNSQVMSDSYANYKSIKADSSKLANIEDAKTWLTKQNTLFDEYNIEKSKGDGYYITSNGQAKQTLQFKNENDLLKNIKQRFYEYNKQFGSSKGQAKYQYSGYLNIKNPYIIDANEANWDEIVTGTDDYSVEALENLSDELKEQLTDLAEKSIEFSKNGRSDMAEYSKKMAEIAQNLGGYTKAREISAEFREYERLFDEARSVLTSRGMLFDDSYFTKNGQELIRQVEDEANTFYNPIDLFNAAKNNFEEESLKNIFSTKSTTNEIIQNVLNQNKNGSNYDGVIIKNVMDYGVDGAAFDVDGAAQDVYVTFNSNQFKAKDNQNPTDDPDWRYSLSNPDDIAPFGEGIKSEQVKPRDIQEVIAPLQDSINQLTQKVDNLTGENRTYPEDLSDLTVDISPFQDMIDRSLAMENGIETITQNFDTIKNDLVQRGMSEDAATNFLQNAVNKYDQEFNRRKVQMSEDKRNKLQKMILDAQEKFTNRNAYVDRLAKDSGNQMIKYKGDLANNSFGQAQYNVQTAQTDLNGNEIGKGVDGLFEQAEKQGLGAVLDDYLFHKSNIERHAVGKGSQVPASVSEQLIRDYEKSYPQLKEWSKGFETYYDNLLQLEVDSGLIDQDTYNLLRGEEGIYRSYMPFFENEAEKRYYDDAGDLKPIKPLKRAKGGANQSKLMGMKQAMTKQTMAVWNSMRTNQLYQEILNTIGSEEGLGFIVRNDPSNLSQSLYTDQDGNKFLTAYVNGEERSTKISDELYNELSRKSENAIKDLEDKYSLLTKPLQGISSFRRNILTSYNPTFALFKNPVKDIQDAVLYSKHTADMLKELPSSYGQLLTNKTKEAKQFRALYGSGEYTGFGKGYAAISEMIELAPRFAEFKASLKAGESVEQAIYNAREVTTNFGRGGYITKAMNRNGFTFLNASVQGFSKFYRNFAEQPNAGQFAMAVGKAAMLGVIPAIFNELAFGSGDDKDEDYEALPSYIKDNYYLFKLGDNAEYDDSTGAVISVGGSKFLRIPKGRALSVFGSAARRTIEFAEGDKDAFDKYLSNAWSQIGPVELGESPLDNTILAPIFQAYGGRKLENGQRAGRNWYGGDLVPTRLQGEKPEDQYDESTDKMSVWIGDKLSKVPVLNKFASPYKINYIIDQYSGALGDFGLPMITPETSNGAETVGEYLIAPIKDQVIVNSVDDNKYAGKFFDIKNKLYTGTKATDEDKVKAKYMDDKNWELSALYKEKREIQSDESLGKKEKYARVQAIQEQINNIAKEAINTYQDVTVSDNYAKVNDKEYYKNAEGKWTTLKDKDSTTVNTLGMNDSEKSQYFAKDNTIYNLEQKYKKLKEGKSDDEIKVLNKQLRQEKLDAIKSSPLSDNAKYAMYGDEFYWDKMTPYYEDLGFKANDIMTYKSNEFTADKDKNGDSIKNSKKKKVKNYIFSMNIPKIQQKILYKKEYKTDTSYDDEIFNYINNSNLDYTSKTKILDELGIKYR